MTIYLLQNSIKIKMKGFKSKIEKVTLNKTMLNLTEKQQNKSEVQFSYDQICG
jgi:hypothetical protein